MNQILPKLETTSVAELMQRSFIQVHPEDRLEQLQRELSGQEVYPQLPVTDSGQMVGFLPLAKLEGLSRELWSQARVDQFLDRDFQKLSIAPGQSAWTALEAMKSGKWIQLFVVEGGHLIGVISANDLLAWVRSNG